MTEASLAPRVSAHVTRLINRLVAVFAQQLDEPGHAALLVPGQVIVDVPAEIIAAELAVKLGPVVDEIVERVDRKSVV